MWWRCGGGVVLGVGGCSVVDGVVVVFGVVVVVWAGMSNLLLCWLLLCWLLLVVGCWLLLVVGCWLLLVVGVVGGAPGWLFVGWRVVLPSCCWCVARCCHLLYFVSYGGVLLLG